MSSERSTSARLDQEVEGKAGEAQQDQRRVRAQEPRLDRADGRAAGTDDPGHPADEQSVDHDALERRLAPAPERAPRPDDERVDRLVEVPLVLEEPVRAGKPLADLRG